MAVNQSTYDEEGIGTAAEEEKKDNDDDSDVSIAVSAAQKIVEKFILIDAKLDALNERISRLEEEHKEERHD